MLWIKNKYRQDKCKIYLSIERFLLLSTWVIHKTHIETFGVVITNSKGPIYIHNFQNRIDNLKSYTKYMEQ